MKNSLYIGLIALVLNFTSCSKPQVDDLNISRFDMALMSVDTLNTLDGVKKLYIDFPEFMPFYVADVMEENPADTLKVAEQIGIFLRDTTFKRVNAETARLFADVSELEKSLAGAFAVMKTNFPDVKIPDIYFFVSGFNRSILIDGNFIGIGADLFLGADFPDYKNISYSYLTSSMTPEAIPVTILSQLIFERTPEMNDERLLDNMIYHGKILYILSELLPEQRPEHIIGYTSEQFKWCKNFEKDIWTLIVEQKHLFSSDLILINKYINDAPFTTPISQESPGRLGAWVGWQIVKSYMKNNRSTDLKTLLLLTDATKILEESAYKP